MTSVIRKHFRVFCMRLFVMTLCAFSFALPQALAKNPLSDTLLDTKAKLIGKFAQAIQQGDLLEANALRDKALTPDFYPDVIEYSVQEDINFFVGIFFKAQELFCNSGQYEDCISYTEITLSFANSEHVTNKAVREFKDQLQGGEEVVVYFAGHGVQLASTNYLLPIDVGGDSADQVKDEAIELQRVLDSLSEKELQFSLAVIDACRDNPFKGAGRAIGGRGLAPTSAATGQMIIFSAGTGQQALDRLGPADKEPNGLFTRVFLKEMQKPGIPVDSMLRQVRKEVVRLAKSVGHEQVPALYDQTVGEFYFKVQ